MNITLTILLQRTIELLAFYLILANINGRDLRESFLELVITKQGVLYGNILLLIGYPLAMTFIIRMVPSYGYSIDLIFYPLVAHLLLRLTFKLNKMFLSYLLSMGIGFIIGIAAFAFSLHQTPLHGIFVFLWILFVVIFMASQNYFEKIYMHLLKKAWLLNALLTISFVMYLTFLFIRNFSIIFPILSLILLFGTIVYFKKEMTIIIGRLRNASSNDFLQILKDLSSEHTESEIIHQYIIKNYSLMRIVPSLLRELDTHKRLGTIKDYECIFKKSQIKINVIL